MATVYRDYGTMNTYSAPNNMITTNPKRQVYQATHRGDGTRLPFMNRSFISFTFGGRFIEDFDLVATFSNNSIDRNGYASFEDIVSSYDILEGQQYWTTHYKTNTLDFTLSTDGIDQKKLDDFLYWFKAGDIKELILAEHPNRAILAHVATQPHLNLLPFEEPAQVKLSGVSYSTSTTLYKGDISLSFIMDQPHWYAIDNVLGQKDLEHNRYIDKWKDLNGNWVDIFTSKDALKILYEDGIPLGSMIQSNMLLGNGGYANVQEEDISLIWSIPGAQIEYENGEPLNGVGARIEANDATFPYSLGVIAGAIIYADGSGISELISGENGYFYYSGTAPAPTIISFTLTPTRIDNYITVPANNYVQNANQQAFNTLTIESITSQELHFTTPNLYTSYNKVMNIFKTYVANNSIKSWEDIRKMIREDVRHIRVREWAIKVINDLLTSNSGALVASNQNGTTLQTNMRRFLADNNDNIKPATFIFNSETGEAKGIFSYRLIDSPNSLTTNIEEDVGDMLRSNYLIIRDRNYPTENGTISSWTSEHPEYSHCIYHDVSVPLTNLSILYKNMYL